MKNDIGQLFLEKTKFQNLSPSDQMRGLPAPPPEIPTGPDLTRISLPEPETLSLPDLSLRRAIEKRKSIRSYADIPIDLGELSFLLWTTQGIKQVFPGATLRTVPSAGARHALETYLLINRVTGLEPGLYRFLALEHALVMIDPDYRVGEKICAACLGQTFVKTCGATFIWAAVPPRMNWRYSERGYRYLFLDAGHVCQNLYLGAEAIQCGVCAIAAFSDDEMNAILKLNGNDQFVIYLATVGKK